MEIFISSHHSKRKETQHRGRFSGNKKYFGLIVCCGFQKTLLREVTNTAVVSSMTINRISFFVLAKLQTEVFVERTL